MDSNNGIPKWRFINQSGDFTLEDPHLVNYLYFPLANEDGMLSAITPLLNGDIKTGQHNFLLTPVSAEDLHNSRSTRNFWIFIEKYGPWSVTGNSARQQSEHFGDDPDKVRVEAGFLWHRLIRENESLGIRSEITNFIPVNDKVELMKVKLSNIGNQPMKITPTAAIPIYGRSADNLRDHRHVTSLLNRIHLNKYGVELQPTFRFDERGHILNEVIYAVLGMEADGRAPAGFYPIVEEFIGEGGSLDWPETVVKNKTGYYREGTKIEGYEALGGLRFTEVTLEPGTSKSYIIMMAIFEEQGVMENLVKKYAGEAAFDSFLIENEYFWQRKLNRLTFKTNNPDYDLWLKWVTLQPFLRRLYGCSFLPHHDYGKGGRGWRDLWQDCLALLILDPAEVRHLLLNNFCGVRIDGSNATIIGTKPGEFSADRNNIVRVWMDHGVWPFFTAKLYLDQSGDFDFLFEEQTYFKDRLINRCKAVDPNWKPEDGNLLRQTGGTIYKGTILEHILVELVTEFFNVGEHNHLKLEGADWNDGLDMAADRGESVAFTAFYASNLYELAALLFSILEKTGITEIEVAAEIMLLIDSLNEKIDYNSVSKKKELLNSYYQSCQGKISGRKVKVKITALISDLQRKAEWITTNIQRTEWLKNEAGFEWFNGYYNNDGLRVEGDSQSGVRMTLTGQVFPIMSGIATVEQISAVVKAVNNYLWDPEAGGYRLNTNFGAVQPNLGRCFGFAFGHKENGAFFNHMTVMYAYALYRRGFAPDGYRVLESLHQLSVDFGKSKIYPGIPEYFNQKARGMYHYLTGSASWLLFVLLTEVFGVKGQLGDLVLEPKLVPEQFDDSGEVRVSTVFYGRQLEVIYRNPLKLDFGSYSIKEVTINGRSGDFRLEKTRARLHQTTLRERSDINTINRIIVELG